MMTPYVMKVVPQYLIRFSLWMLTHTIFSVRMKGQHHVPFRGPALLVCNHVSFVDSLLVGACVQRFIRFVIYSSFFNIKGLGALLRTMQAIPAGDGEQKTVAHAVKRAREALEQGHVVCVFAEGAISRSEDLLPFENNFEQMVAGSNVPIIPVHLEGLRGTIFSEQEGGLSWKWPKKILLPVSITFGSALPASTKAQEVRRVVIRLKTA